MSAEEIQGMVGDLLAQGKRQEVLEKVQGTGQIPPDEPKLQSIQTIFRKLPGGIFSRSSSERERDEKPADELDPDHPLARELRKQDELRECLQAKADLYNESEGHLNSLDGIDCPLCRNRGYAEEVRFNGYCYSILVECQCQKRRKSWRRLQNSGMAGSIRRQTFESFEVTSAWQERIRKKAEQYVHDEEDRWFYIGGAVGCGKTHICTAICGQLLAGNKSVRYMCWPEESVRLKGLVNEEEYNSRVRGYKECEVLYIDDLFKLGRARAAGGPSDADVKLAYQIINARYIARKKTILSSEWLMDELMDFDEATASRIYEMSKGYALQIARDKGRNYRFLESEQGEKIGNEELD